MSLLFLQTATLDDAVVGGALAGGLMALIGAFIVFFLILALALWIYTSFAYMAIAKKNKQATPGLAWIPLGIGPSIVAYKASKMHWWPFIALGLSFVPVAGSIASVVFMVMFIVWNWKMFEAINKPGWWSIFIILFPVYLILLGIAAWSKN